MGKVLLQCLCFLALTVLLHAASLNIYRCREIQKVVKKINQIANKTHPLSFHVPTDVKEECLDTALKCFQSQAHKLHVATRKNKPDLDNCIRKVKLSNPHDRESCTPCSNYTEQSPEVFLNRMELLLQKIVNNFKS
ncbi:interleukin-21 [Ranitomeya variabilis]|uniref:interleukin-21 n=1 Tax=Ranitomeya variabilis TaxID=490064 RepID=UPI004055C94E